MRQVLFRIPPWSDDGVPVYGFGLMLFLTFVACTWVAGKRAEKEGVNKQLIQDLAVWLFAGGIIGARIVYMIQYGIPFWPPWNFFKIWEGGLVFYGSAFGGLAAFALFHRISLRRQGVGFLQMLDIIAPAVALGLCLGRVGCLLNGCCYGHVACGDCPAIHFPLSAPPRFTLVKDGYQTAAGFTLAEMKEGDPLSVIGQVEPGSKADVAGLKPGDMVVGVDGQENLRILEVRGRDDLLEKLASRIGRQPSEILGGLGGASLWQFSFGPQDKQSFAMALQETEKQRFDGVSAYDTLWDQLQKPRSRTSLTLTVQRGEKVVDLPPFWPRTLGLHPTQVYETISMALLFFVLAAWTPLRRRYGEVFVLLVFGYALHRFINEMLRNDTDPITLGRFETHMTLSQNISILFAIVGVVLAIIVWRRPVDFPRPSAGAA
jgi:prolipoprotein diacylglyceryltransferase